jgi:hypothetical protein
MLGQATLSSTRIWISKDTNWEWSARRLEDMVTRPDATQCSRIFFTDVEMSDSVDHPDARLIRLDAVLFWEEMLYSGKVVAEDRPDATCQSLNLIRIRFFVSL